MREIKFDYIIKRNDETIGHRVWSLNNLEFGDTAEWYLCMLKNNSKVIAKRQYIGLFDKNGVEIYEGDIVKHSQFNECIFEYRFIEGIFKAVEFIDGDEQSDWNISAYDLLEYCEVIGNIYENSELLK